MNGNSMASAPALAGVRSRDGAESEAAQTIARAQAGDQQAFERLYREHVGWVYALCLRMVGDPTEAETLTQDAFVRAWQKLDRYRGSGAFGGWLRRLTVNLVIEDRRARSRRARWLAGGDPADHDAPVAPPDTETALDLERAVRRLPEGARIAFVLHDVEGYRHAEIAAWAGLAPGTIKAQLHRARRLLRAALGGREEAPA